MMLVMVSLKSLRRLVEDKEEEEGLGRWRGTCCSFRVSPGRWRRRKQCGKPRRKEEDGGEQRWRT